jgi:hypothetical protein
MSSISCPKCGCTQIASNNQGFGLGKAAVGGILAGPVGLLAGFLGSSNIKITCLQCGHSWAPHDPAQNQLTGCLIETIFLYLFGIAIVSLIISFIIALIFDITNQIAFFICAGALIILISLICILQYSKNKKIEQKKIDLQKEQMRIQIEEIKSTLPNIRDNEAPEGLNNFKWGRNEHINNEKLQLLENKPDEAIYRITSGDELLVYGHKADSIIYSFYKENLYKITVYFEFENRKDVVEDIKMQLKDQYGDCYNEITSIMCWNCRGVYIKLSNETLIIENFFIKNV